MDPGSIRTPNLGYVWSALSTVSFVTTNLLLCRVVPRSARNTKQQEWKWRNTANSLLHSVITGIWACHCFWQSPEIRENLISSYTESSHHVLSVSLGTFVVFRIATLGWMTRWLVLVRHHLTTTAFTMGGLAMPIILVMNVVLFVRVLNADYCGKQPSSRDCSYIRQLMAEEEVAAKGLADGKNA